MPTAPAESLPASMPTGVLLMLIAVPTTTLQAPVRRSVNTPSIFGNGTAAELSDVVKKERRPSDTFKSLLGIEDQEQLTTESCNESVKCESFKKALVDMGLGLKVPEPKNLDDQQDLNYSVQLHKLSSKGYGSCKEKREECHLIVATVQVPHFRMNEGSLSVGYTFFILHSCR